MNIRLLPFLFLLLWNGNLLAKSITDSLTIANNQWNTKTIAKGIVWKQANFNNLFKSRQEVNIVEFELNNKHFEPGLAAISKGMLKTSEFANQENAIVAINGSFFDTKVGGSVTYVRKDGNTVNFSTMNKDGKISERANAALMIDNENRTVQIVGAEKENINWEEQLVAKDIMVCGPLLLQNNFLVKLENNAFNKNRHPRSAIAITDDRLLFITVDGRNKNAEGMNLDELAYFLKIMGVHSALNLDGGGSTTLYIKGIGESGIVNYPSDNKLFDHEGERPVANVILIQKR